jgi:hypothetical protein
VTLACASFVNVEKRLKFHQIPKLSLRFRVLPESPRWLLAVGRNEEAIRILEQAARHNKLDTEGIAQKVESARILKVGLTLTGAKELRLRLIKLLI